MYAINRLYDLQSEKFSIFKNNSGGRFLNDNWISVYPTDSQVNIII